MDSRQLLQTLPSGDKLGPRRSAGLGLMQYETEQLRTYIDDLETSLATNHQLLHDVLAQSIRCIAGTGETTEDTASNPEHIQELLQRNKKLEEELKTSIRDRNEAQGRALINEQIANEYQEKEQEVTQEFDDLIRELDYQIDKREKIKAELDIRAETLEKEVELIRKSRDVTIVSLSEPTLKMHNFIEKVRARLQDVGRELHRTRERKEQLQELCKQLYADLSKAQASIRNHINRRVGSEWNQRVPRRDLSFDSGYRRNSLSDHSEEEAAADSFEEPGVIQRKRSFKPKAMFTAAKDLQKPPTDIYRSLQEESFKRPKRTQVEERLEEEIYHLSAKAEDLGKRLEVLTAELLDVMSINDQLTSENVLMACEIEEAQKTLIAIEKTATRSRLDPKARGSTLIKEHQISNPIAVLRVRREGNVPLMPNTTKVDREQSGSMEIVVRSESFYGEDDFEESLEEQH